jgi:hypothetical protein
VRQLFIRAVESQLNMPPKCCSLIPLHAGIKYLSKDEAARYRVAFEEWSTEGKDRLYCPKLQCSAFIPLKSMGQARRAAAAAAARKDSKKRDSKDVAVPEPRPVVVDCPECSTATCLVCKNFAHPAEACSFEAKDATLVAQLRKWGYKQCPRCRHGVRKMYGCSHMMCLCGEHFCWNCERNYMQCDNEGDCVGDEEEEEDVGSLDDGLDLDEEEEDGEEQGPTEEAAATTATATTATAATATAAATAATAATAAATAATAAAGNQRQDQDHYAPHLHIMDDGPADVPAVLIAAEAFPATTPPRRRRDSDNLDAGSDGYWNNQPLDFGFEPEEPSNMVWGCAHSWTASTATADSADAGEANVPKECHECWKAIGGKGWRCSWCGTLACEACRVMFERRLNGSTSDGETD